MFILGIIGLAIIFAIILVLGAFTVLGVAFVNYLIPILLIFMLCVGLFAWSKIVYKKIKLCLYKKKNYPNGIFEI